jgi:hypothetical protein
MTDDGRGGDIARTHQLKSSTWLATIVPLVMVATVLTHLVARGLGWEALVYTIVVA